MKIDGFNKEYSGLNNKEIKEASDKYGLNVLETKKKETVLTKIIGVFKEPMFILLLITSLIYFFLGEITDGLVMIIFVVFVSGIEFIQEWKTDKALESLRKMTSLNTKVIRNNKIEMIKNENVTVGDLVILEEGDKVPADGVILEHHDLGIDESILTGESDIVFKKLEADDNLFKSNMCYMGTKVIVGSAIIKITNIGFDTEYGHIGSSLDSIKKDKTPLEKQISKLIFICTIFSLLFCLGTIIINFINNYSLDIPFKEKVIESILSGITIAMATIPEEIPVILTVFLAMGAFELVKKNALVRNINSVETLGAVTVLCTDKTGTLTQNKMTLKETYGSDNLLYISSLACESKPYDPMEQSILEYSYQNGISKSIFEHELVHEYSFNAETKMMGHIWKIDNQNLLCVKGAYESVLPLCDLSNKKEIENKIKEFSNEGYRVIAVASKAVDKIEENLKDNKLNFEGLLAFMDPPREGVIESIQTCYEAGIRVIMITGDNGDTASSIAKKIGIVNSGEVITGLQLEKMSDSELQEKVKTVNIFARVYPNHKMRIVEALQKNNEVVAMTGDGVNDAPALKKSSIGIAMGKRGTDVAKDASDMILLDDNFSTIVNAVKNGRKIYDNIRKAISYVLIIHIPIAFATILIPLFKYSPLLLPVHIVILELIIDPTSSIIFERIKSSKNIMKRKPRKMDDPLVTKKILITSLIQGLVMMIFFVLSYMICLNLNNSKCFATTFALTVLILSELFIVNVIESDEFAIKNFINNLKDKVFVIINLVIFIGLLLIIYVPVLNGIMGTCALTLKQFLICLLLAFVCTHWYEIVKIFIKDK